MAVKFKYMPSLSQSYERQGEIFFTCRNYHNLLPHQQQRIRDICEEAAGGNGFKRAALLEFMTTGASWRYVCIRYYISDSTLERMRKEFYRLWEIM